MRSGPIRQKLCKLTCVALFALTTWAAPVQARDRPGTPSEVRVTDCGTYAFDELPHLCVVFKNTAKEPVGFVMDWFSGEKNSPYLKKMPAELGMDADCHPTRSAQLYGCSAFASWLQHPSRHGSYIKSYGQYEGLMLKNLSWDKQYCFSFETVDADSIISETWSTRVCGVTQSAPGVPLAPGKPVLTPQPASDGLHRAGGATPAKLLVEWKASATQNNHFRRYAIQKYSPIKKQWESAGVFYAPTVEAAIDVDYREPGLAIRVCAVNISGAGCSDPSGIISANVGNSASSSKSGPTISSTPRPSVFQK